MHGGAVLALRCDVGDEDAILRFRERAGGPEPKANHGNTLLEIAWTLAPALVLVLIAIPTIKTIWDVDRPARGESHRVHAFRGLVDHDEKLAQGGLLL